MIKEFFSKKKLKAQSTTEELVERGFAPQNGKIHILLINPPSTISERYGRKDLGEVGGDMIPLGIACLAGYLREKGYGVGVLDCPTLRIDADKVYEIIKQKDPAIIGFSTTTYALTRAIDIADKIRNKLPTKLTVIGGSHTNVAGIETANEYSNYFDIIAYGLDGEYIIHNIVKKYSENNFNRDLFLKDFQTLENIKGIIFKKNNVAVRNKPSEVIENLDDLPFPARDLFPTERYMPLPNNYKQLPATNMIVIRGCPYFCTFCDQAGTGARRRSPHKVIEEIKDCVENYGIREISFWDDTMCYHKKWMHEFLDLLIEANLDLSWTCCAAVNTVDDKDLLRKMRKSGCWNIFYGYETGVEELAKNILTNKKNRDFEKMKRIPKWTREADIEVRAGFLVGLPGETPELAKKTIQTAIELDPDYAQFTVCCPYPGTKLADEIHEGKWGKFITHDLKDYQMWSVTWLPFGYKNAKELKNMERYAFRKFYLRPSYVIKRILKIRSFEDIKRYFKGGTALIKGFL
jgi:radical SAM superfamily enzyme YgiQ (UPF0313 family)